MNRMILTSLVLPSVLGLAQAGMAVEPKPMTSSVVLLAEATQPSGLAQVALAAGKANASMVAANSAIRAEVKESIKTSYSNLNFAEVALNTNSGLEYALKGDVRLDAQAPRVTKAVEVALTPQDLAEAAAVTSVTVHAIVDENGIPQNVTVTKSAGANVDAKAIAAVKQYRFVPATVDNLPTSAAVTVSIKIQK